MSLYPSLVVVYIAKLDNKDHFRARRCRQDVQLLHKTFCPADMEQSKRREETECRFECTKVSPFKPSKDCTELLLLLLIYVAVAHHCFHHTVTKSIVYDS